MISTFGGQANAAISMNGFGLYYPDAKINAVNTYTINISLNSQNLETTDVFRLILPSGISTTIEDTKSMTVCTMRTTVAIVSTECIYNANLAGQRTISFRQNDGSLGAGSGGVSDFIVDIGPITNPPADEQ
jgi:hypothetical protein